MKLNDLINQPDAFTMLEIDDITNKPQATSLRLAKVMGLQHKNVLQAIRRQKERAEEVLTGVIDDTEVPSEYVPFLLKVNPVFTADEYQNDQNGEYYPFYRLNRDACVVTIAQLQGKKAMAWILAYIGAFNMLEDEYKRGRETTLQTVREATKLTITNEMEKLRKEIKAEIQKAVKQLR